MSSLSVDDALTLIRSLGELGPQAVQWLASVYNSNIRYVSDAEIGLFLTKYDCPNERPRLFGVLKRLEMVQNHVSPPLPKILEKLYEKGHNPAIEAGSPEAYALMAWNHNKVEGWLIHPDVLLWSARLSGNGKSEGEKRSAKQRKTRKANGNDDARTKIIAALILHHKYNNGAIGDYSPIGVKELTEKAGLGSKSTASKFFTDEWCQDGSNRTGWPIYRSHCCNLENQAKLRAWLMMLNGDNPMKV
ncbi:MAG TPA: hypothetical protein PLN21_06590 [Gemmatales bacterium]|nr:hypothetical protein [Gemmatales bacterium]